MNPARHDECNDRPVSVEWNHNTYYQSAILRRLPRRCERVLDVGCGAGSLTVRLADRFKHVDAIDASPTMIDAARRRTPTNVNCVLGDVMRAPLPRSHYDAIVSLTSLHHLPLRAALLRLAPALRPGGALVAVGLPRTDLPRDLLAESLAVVGQQAFGLSFALLRWATPRSWYGPDPASEGMPTVDPAISTHEVRAVAAEALPGSRVRRLVFWRYLLHWHRPAAG